LAATATPTPTPAGSAGQLVVVNLPAGDFAPGGPISPPLTLTVGQADPLVFHHGDPPPAANPPPRFSRISHLRLPAAVNTIALGQPDVVIPAETSPPFAPQAFQRGTYPFTCTNVNCGGDPQQHAGMIGLLIIQ